MTLPYLGLALYAEGPGDHRFLDGIIRRSVEHALVSLGLTVDVSEIQRLAISQSDRREDRIAEGAVGIQGAFHLLFVHADGNGDRERAISERVIPGANRVLAELGTQGRRVVPVVPARETEAWAIVDGNALRRVLSTQHTDAELGVPNQPREVETVADPKAIFGAAVTTARGGRRGIRPRPPGVFLERLSEEIDLQVLREVPAFQSFEHALKDALQDLGYVSIMATDR